MLKDRLTPRQTSIANLVIIGLTNKQIATELGIVEQVVKNHLHQIYNRIGCDNKLQLALWLLEDERKSQTAQTAA